jgi:hypothetical protein
MESSEDTRDQQYKSAGREGELSTFFLKTILVDGVKYGMGRHFEQSQTNTNLK